MTAEFLGRRILVTGAASGIGEAIVMDLAREGALVALLDMNAAALARVAAAIDGLAEGARGLAFPVDLLDVPAVERAVMRAADALGGGLDGVVNCAGVVDQGSIEDLDIARWMHVLGVNLTAPYVVCRSALPFLQAADDPAIVNIASAAALLPDSPRVTAYVASKGGLVAFSKALAAEVAPKVRVNAVCPGLTRTPMVEDRSPAVTAPSPQRYALRRAAQPSEISSAVQFLLSPRSSFITGVALAVDGGRTFH